SSISFFFAAHSDLFEEVAKFRAARRLWATIVRDRYGGSDKSCRLRFHTQTGGSTLTAQQPLNNVVRVTVQALAAILGGTQSLHTNSFDEALALPSEDAARLALRTQQVLAFESGVAQTADPLGGSYYVEYLTDTIEREATDLLDEIAERGGAARAIQSGFFQSAISQAAYAHQQEIEAEERVLVGVNRFAEDEQPSAMASPDYSVLAEQQRERVRATRAKRDSAKCRTALERLEEGARGDAAMMPLIVDAVRTRATVGEISDTLREAWGVYRPA
ncbi:MAG: methylmalonyl-CoA mutase, partial [Gemmatimonadetes bacterium]|nr:methylmalonyl-CoA mutase [Gemmatimonadota bacterium]